MVLRRDCEGDERTLLRIVDVADSGYDGPDCRPRFWTGQRGQRTRVRAAAARQPVAEFGRMFHVPDGEVGGFAGLQRADLVEQAQCARALARDAAERFVRRQAETACRHVDAISGDVIGEVPGLQSPRPPWGRRLCAATSIGGCCFRAGSRTRRGVSTATVCRIAPLPRCRLVEYSR